MVGTLLTAPATWKLSTLQIVSAFGCASEKVRKSSLKNDNNIQYIRKVSLHYVRMSQNKCTGFDTLVSSVQQDAGLI